MLALGSILSCTNVMGQRFADRLDRGLVAVKTSSGVYCSWRIQADEYYDVKYNLYRDGTKVNAEPLDVSNYTDAGGATVTLSRLLSMEWNRQNLLPQMFLLTTTKQ